MRITQGEVVDRQTVLNIELEDEDLNPYLDQGYRKVVQRIVIPGFRKGKAPRRIVENFIGREMLLNEVLDTMLPQVTGQAIDAQEIEMGGMPNIELVELDPLIVKATVPLTPEVDLGAYRDVRVEEESAEVTEEDIDAQLEQIRGNLATWDPVEDRAVQIDDMATITVKGEVDDETIIDETDVPFVLIEDNPSPIPGFTEQLVGMDIDSPKEFTIEVPEDFANSEVAGKEAKFTVTITDIKERNLPELDDELAKSVGDEYETLDDLRKRITEDLTTRKENEVKQKYQESAIQALMDSSTVELPPVMVDHEVRHMEEERNNYLGQMNILPEDFLTRLGKTAEEAREELSEEAINRIKRTLVLSELAKKEDIEVSDGEVETRIETLFESEDEEDHEGHDHTVTDDMRDSVRRMLHTEYTIDRLVLIAKGEAPPLPESNEDASESADESEDAEDAENEGNETTESESTTEGGDTDDPQA